MKKLLCRLAFLLMFVLAGTMFAENCQTSLWLCQLNCGTDQTCKDGCNCWYGCQCRGFKCNDTTNSCSTEPLTTTGGGGGDPFSGCDNQGGDIGKTPSIWDKYDQMCGDEGLFN